MANGKKIVKFRQQASVEAEVAQSKIALASQDLESGNVELAYRRSVEAAFDAGIAQGYAEVAKEKDKFKKVTKGLLSEAKAIAEQGDLEEACDGAYVAGTKYAQAQAKNKDTQAALIEYEEVIDEVGVGRAANPVRTPQIPVKRLKARLLR